MGKRKSRKTVIVDSRARTLDIEKHPEYADIIKNAVRKIDDEYGL